MNIHEEPLHAGEIFHLWSYLEQIKQNVIVVQVFISQVSDKDLRVYLEDLLDNCIMKEIEQVEEILKELGIRIPPAPPDRPKVELQDIPAGVRLNDSEIANQMKKDFLLCKNHCSYMTTITHQKFIFTMYTDFYMQRLEYEHKLFLLMKEKGWINVPPVHVK